MQCIAQGVKRSFHSDYDFVDGDLWSKMHPRMLYTASYPHVDVIKCGCSFCLVLEYLILRGDSLIPSGHFVHSIVQGLHKSQLELDCTNSPARATLGRSGSVLSFSVLLPVHLFSSNYDYWSTEAGTHLSGLLFVCTNMLIILMIESHLTSFCITAEEDPRNKTFCIPVKLMLCYKLNNLPVHHRHTAMDLYEIMLIS